MPKQPQRPGGKRPAANRTDRRAAPTRKGSNDRDIYSNSAQRRTRDREPMVDISSYSDRAHRRSRAQEEPVDLNAYSRRQQEDGVRYHDGYTFDDSPEPYGTPRREAGRPQPPRGRRKKKRHVFRNILCVCLALVLLGCVWATALFAKMQRPQLPDRLSYVQQPAKAPSDEPWSSFFVTNILLIGMDKDQGGVARSDSIMLLSVDRLHGKMKTISFLRDTYVEIPGHKAQKLNAAFAFGGPALLMQTIENNFRVKIDKYIGVGYDDFAALMSKMGGIEVTLDEALCKEFNKNLGTQLKPGKQTLTGNAALYYTRIRNVGNDFGRTQRQREVVSQLLGKLGKMDPVAMTRTLGESMPLLQTNIPALEMTGLCLLNLPAVFSGKDSLQIPAKDQYSAKKVSGVGAVLVPDLPQNCKLLRAFLEN